MRDKLAEHREHTAAPRLEDLPEIRDWGLAVRHRGARRRLSAAAAPDRTLRDWREPEPGAIRKWHVRRTPVVRSEASMFTHLLAARHASRAPIPGTFVSLTAHASLLAAVVGSDGTGAGRADSSEDAPTRTAARERLHWVGIGYGPAEQGARAASGAAPPSRTWCRSGAAVVRVPSAAAAGRRGRRGGGGADAPPTDAPRPDAARRTRTARPEPFAAMPTVVLPDPDATLLVAGVLSAAPDPMRAVSRAEEFVRLPPPRLDGEPLAGTAVSTVAGLSALLHVDALPIPLVSNAPPSYPAALARARVGGRVLVEFRIDSLGVVDPRSLRVVQSSDVLFTQAVQSVLPRLRFLPAQLGRHAVGVTVRQPFVFPGARRVLTRLSRPASVRS
jgi:protein TonB